jgi:hypothetical protein
MLSICLDCKSKHFSAGQTPQACGICGSRRLAVVSAAALLRTGEERKGSPLGTQG